MKFFLIPEKGKFYKANLHCHTTVSDGRRTPAEIKADYMAQGYSIVAYTDHELMYPHPELSDDSFLAMNGYEMSVNSPGEVWGRQRVCHICLVATRDDIEKQVCWNRKRGHACFCHHHAERYKKELPCALTLSRISLWRCDIYNVTFARFYTLDRTRCASSLPRKLF